MNDGESTANLWRKLQLKGLKTFIATQILQYALLMPINFVHLQSTMPPVASSQNLAVLARSLCYDPSNSCIYTGYLTVRHFILLHFGSSTVSSASRRPHMYVGFHINSLLFLFNVNQIWIFSKDFSGSSQQNISRKSYQWESSWLMWAGGLTNIRDDGNGSFLHLFYENTQICENFKDMSRQTHIGGRTAFD